MNQKLLIDINKTKDMIINFTNSYRFSPWLNFIKTNIKPVNEITIHTTEQIRYWKIWEKFGKNHAEEELMNHKYALHKLNLPTLE